MTIEAVAAEAGAGKATIYRRWASKTDLVLDVIRVAEQPPSAATVVAPADDLRATLEALLAALADWLTSPIGAATRAVLSASLLSPALVLVRASTGLVAWREVFNQSWQPAGERGDLLPGIDAALAAEATTAPLLTHWLLSQPISRAVIDAASTWLSPLPCVTADPSEVRDAQDAVLTTAGHGPSAGLAPESPGRWRARCEFAFGSSWVARRRRSCGAFD